MARKNTNEELWLEISAAGVYRDEATPGESTSAAGRSRSASVMASTSDGVGASSHGNVVMAWLMSPRRSRQLLAPQRNAMNPVPVRWPRPVSARKSLKRPDPAVTASQYSPMVTSPDACPDR